MKPSVRWLLFEYEGRELAILSKPFKTNKLAEKARQNIPTEYACGFRKFWQVNSGNSGTVSTSRQDFFQVEVTGSPRGSVEMNEASSFEDPVEDGCGHIFVV